MYCKPTDSHLYLNAKSSHPHSQIFGIAKELALRLRKICSDDEDFQKKKKECCQYLIDCGHDRKHVLKVLNEISNVTRQERRQSKRKAKSNHCVFISKFNPRLPNIYQIVKKHSTVDNDGRPRRILPEGSLRVSCRRGSNSKELLAPSNPFKHKEKTGVGFFACKAARCDCCKNFHLPRRSFCSVASGTICAIRKSLTCPSRNVVYLVTFCDV